MLLIDVTRVLVWLCSEQGLFRRFLEEISEGGSDILNFRQLKISVFLDSNSKDKQQHCRKHNWILVVSCIK